MLVVPMRYDDVVVGVITLSKLGLDQFDGHDLRLLSILADQAATALESARNLARSHAWPASCGSSSRSAASWRQPRRTRSPNILARHLASVMQVEECAISCWDRAIDRVTSIGYYPPTEPGEIEPFFEVDGYPQTRRVLDDQVVVMVDVADPDADPAEVALLVETGSGPWSCCRSWPRASRSGWSSSCRGVDRARRGSPSLARTIANEAAIALENARLYEEARASPTATR